MNLSKVEKIIIMVLVVGGILALGIIFLCKPAYESIEKAENNLTRAETEYDELVAKLARLDTIDADIEVSRDAVSELEEKFYPDLTTYEAVEIALAHLKEYNLTTYSVSTSTLSTKGLSLEYYTETPIIYNLKTYAENAKEVKEGEYVLAEGEFLDDDKVYFITVSSLSSITITNKETGEVVEAGKYTDTMKTAYIEALCKYAATGKLGQTVSAISVSFEVSGKYKDYLDYIDYIYNFERASYLPTVEIPMSLVISPDEDGKYLDQEGKEISVPAGTTGDITMDYSDDDEVENIPITLVLYGVEQIEELESIDISGTEVITNQ